MPFFGWENGREYGIIGGQAAAAQLFELLHQFASLGSQTGAAFFIGVNNLDPQMLFGGLDFAPDGFVGHFQNLGRLIDRAGLVNAFQNIHAALAEDDIVVLIDDPMAGSEF